MNDVFYENLLFILTKDFSNVLYRIETIVILYFLW